MVVELCRFLWPVSVHKKKLFSWHGISRNARHWTRWFSEYVSVQVCMCMTLAVHSRFSFNAQSLVFFYFGLIKRLRPIYFVYMTESIKTIKKNKSMRRNWCVCVSHSFSLFLTQQTTTTTNTLIDVFISRNLSQLLCTAAPVIKYLQSKQQQQQQRKQW